MPVTFVPATRTGGVHDTPPATSRDIPPVTAASLLSAASSSANVDPKARIIRSCIGGHPGPDSTNFKIIPAPRNGFVDTVLCAYAHHHALIIRPDDVWLAVVSQFSFYATAAGFLDKAKIVGLALAVESDASAQPDVARLSRKMTRLLKTMLPDAEFRDWLVPEFSTTTLTDVMVSRLLVLSSLCAGSAATQTRAGGNADYTLGETCGIPRVTLEGERADWEMVVARLEPLKTRYREFGLPAVAWYHLLHPILAHFVDAFANPDGTENREFWAGIVAAKDASNGSGAGSKNAGKLSGWITAFCAFSVEGKWLGPELTASAAADAPETLTAAQFWSTYTRPFAAALEKKPKPKSKAAKAKAKKTLQFEDLDAIPESAAPAPTIMLALADMPPTSASVDFELTLNIKAPVTSNDAGMNGTETKQECGCTVLAGLVGTGFSSSRDTELNRTGKNNTVRPVVAWWIFERSGGEAAEEKTQEKPQEQGVETQTPAAEDLETHREPEGDAAVAIVVSTHVSGDADTPEFEDLEPAGENVAAIVAPADGYGTPAPGDLEPARDTATAILTPADGYSDADTPAPEDLQLAREAAAARVAPADGVDGGDADPPTTEDLEHAGEDAAAIVSPADAVDGGDADPPATEDIEPVYEAAAAIVAPPEGVDGDGKPEKPGPENLEPAGETAAAVVAPVDGVDGDADTTAPEPAGDTAGAVVAPADGEDGDGDADADADAPANAKSGGKNNANAGGGGRGGKGKKKKGKR
ncbi:hypothetical protein B0H12DRAFT_406158 [Mycena haematopus]|nr:hypothetical protein B0H12DRAFT_406158 [Mycena haematopus]